MNAPGPSERATSFGAWANEYDDWRPTYPDAAVDWLVPPDGARVVEVGAGTGKLTDRLSERDLDLDAVEPDRRMLASSGSMPKPLECSVNDCSTSRRMTL